MEQYLCIFKKQSPYFLKMQCFICVNYAAAEAIANMHFTSSTDQTV